MAVHNSARHHAAAGSDAHGHTRNATNKRTGDDEPVGFDVAAHAASRRDLHLAGGDQRALVDALDDGVDGALVGFAVAVIVAGVVLGLIGRTIGKR